LIFDTNGNYWKILRPFSLYFSEQSMLWFRSL
jgi:hypothetical protein